MGFLTLLCGGILLTLVGYGGLRGYRAVVKNKGVLAASMALLWLFFTPVSVMAFLKDFLARAKGIANGIEHVEFSTFTSFERFALVGMVVSFGLFVLFSWLHDKNK